MYSKRRTAATLLLFAVSALTAVQCSSHRHDARTVSAPKNRKIEFINESGKLLTVEWVNPKTGDMVALDKTFEDGAKVAFDSFINHTFAVHEASVNEACSSLDAQSCNIQLITVSESDQQGKEGPTRKNL
jgi:hypothetical protein